MCTNDMMITMIIMTHNTSCVRVCPVSANAFLTVKRLKTTIAVNQSQFSSHKS